MRTIPEIIQALKDNPHCIEPLDYDPATATPAELRLLVETLAEVGRGLQAVLNEGYCERIDSMDKVAVAAFIATTPSQYYLLHPHLFNRVNHFADPALLVDLLTQINRVTEGYQFLTSYLNAELSRDDQPAVKRFQQLTLDSIKAIFEHQPIALLLAVADAVPITGINPFFAQLQTAVGITALAAKLLENANTTTADARLWTRQPSQPLPFATLLAQVDVNDRDYTELLQAMIAIGSTSQFSEEDYRVLPFTHQLKLLELAFAANNQGAFNDIWLKMGNQHKATIMTVLTHDALAQSEMMVVAKQTHLDTQTCGTDFVCMEECYGVYGRRYLIHYFEAKAKNSTFGDVPVIEFIRKALTFYHGKSTSGVLADLIPWAIRRNLLDKPLVSVGDSLDDQSLRQLLLSCSLGIGLLAAFSAEFCAATSEYRDDDFERYIQSLTSSYELEHPSVLVNVIRLRDLSLLISLLGKINGLRQSHIWDYLMQPIEFPEKKSQPPLAYLLALGVPDNAVETLFHLYPLVTLYAMRLDAEHHSQLTMRLVDCVGITEFLDPLRNLNDRSQTLEPHEKLVFLQNVLLKLPIDDQHYFLLVESAVKLREQIESGKYEELLAMILTRLITNGGVEFAREHVHYKKYLENACQDYPNLLAQLRQFYILCSLPEDIKSSCSSNEIRANLALKHALCFSNIIDYFKIKYGEVRDIGEDSSDWKLYMDRLTHFCKIRSFIRGHNNEITFTRDFAEYIEALEPPKSQKRWTKDRYKSLITELLGVPVATLRQRFEDIEIAIVKEGRGDAPLHPLVFLAAPDLSLTTSTASSPPRALRSASHSAPSSPCLASNGIVNSSPPRSPASGAAAALVSPKPGFSFRDAFQMGRSMLHWGSAPVLPPLQPREGPGVIRSSTSAALDPPAGRTAPMAGPRRASESAAGPTAPPFGAISDEDAAWLSKPPPSQQ